MSFATQSRAWIATVPICLLTLGAATCNCADGPPPRRVLVTISKETTYITEPLRKDGYPDYVAALNERFSKGVTPESNFLVLYWKAVGPAAIDEVKREAYFKLLGIPRIPDKGAYFISYEDFAAKQQTAPRAPDFAASRVDDEVKRFRDSGGWRPWSAKEFPIHAQWLEANEKPLSLLAEASKRPRHFDPLVLAPLDGGVTIAPLPATWQFSKDIARAFVLRAMLRLNENKIAAARSDLLVVHRVGRLLAQGPTLQYALESWAVDGAAFIGERQFLRHVRLSANDAEETYSELAKLSPVAPIADYIDVGERFMMLETAASVARGTVKLAGADKLEVIDWDLIMRLGNQWYDRVAKAMREPTRAKRKEAVTKLERDFKEATNSGNVLNLVSSLLGPRDALSRGIGMKLLGLLMPRPRGPLGEDHAMEFEVTMLGFALAAYHGDHGCYPAKLAELVPRYVADIPKDVFSGDDLIYKREGDGYLLYSVGPNGVDDDGKGYDDRTYDETWDDISIRVPGWAKGKVP